MSTHLKLLTTISNKVLKHEEINERVKELLKDITNEIKTCVSTRRDSDLVFILPESTFLLPKQYLKEHIETKWEKFARKKGIKNRKRRALVYDEEIGEYIQRYGPYSKKNRILGAAVRDGEITTSTLKRMKKKNVEKNKANMLANRSRNG